MENTNKTAGETATFGEGVTETPSKKVNAPSVFEVKTQKQKLEAEKDLITAIYFAEGKRLLTYGNISYQKATLELIKFQNSESKPITMIVVKDLPFDEVSRDLKDYMKYIVEDEVEKTINTANGEAVFVRTDVEDKNLWIDKFIPTPHIQSWRC